MVINDIVREIYADKSSVFLFYVLEFDVLLEFMSLRG